MQFHVRRQKRLERESRGASDGSVRIELLVAGDGKTYPKPGDVVTVHYTGFVSAGHAAWTVAACCCMCSLFAGRSLLRLWRLLYHLTVTCVLLRLPTRTQRKDGTKFDSTADRGKPFTFTLGQEQVIKGLDQAVSRLSIGDVAKVNIDADLAYGKRGFPGLIPPNHPLMFELELVAVGGADSDR